MAPVFSAENSDLVADLHRIAKTSPKLVKSSIYAAPADPNVNVRSWKMNEFKYYDIPSPFPTLARGLFSVEIPTEGADEPKYRIVARGYDKFFNIGEVPWTTWASLKDRTAAPYTLSLKSNGCIIFIAALSPSKLLITSKHSIGPVAGNSLSHAQAGEQWIRTYLAEKGRTEADIASVLWESNWTAIAELCDDSFEEHVLAYPPEKTGLHLHGINTCSKAFNTLPHEQVDAFAKDWGFIKTPTVTLDSIDAVQKFTEHIGETGEWEGEPVEGFVVRTHVVQPPAGTDSQGQSPYPPGSSFFFKVKFDEPYMMYRDWREVTKSLLSSNKGMSAANLPKHKMKRAETKLYVDWVIKEIKQNPKQFALYTKGKGIIAVREKFLKWMKTEKRPLPLESKPIEPVNFGKTIIVPVAVPGCGKTTVALALARIFGFGHTQSDDITVKKTAPAFVRNTMALLKNHDVVIADKNNHLKQHRQALRDAVAKMDPPVRLLALNWALDQPPAMVHRICADRVLQRGDKHQTLRAKPNDQSHEEVIWMFINNTEDLADIEVDECIEMEIEESPEEAIRRAVDGCVRILGLERPSEVKIQEALGAIQNYMPSTKTRDAPTKPISYRYFALLPEMDLVDILDKRLRDSNESTAFWEELKSKNRVAKRPHITIVHRNGLPGDKALWDQCARLQNMASLFKGKLGTVVWNNRVMAVTLEDLSVVEVDGLENTEAHQLVEKLPEHLKKRLHITVGTRDGSVPAVEGKALVENWRAGKSAQDVHSLILEGEEVQGLLKGMTG